MAKSIKRSRKFDRNFKERVSRDESLVRAFKESILLFLEDRSDKSLDDHQLEGRMYRFRAFSVTDEIRVVYVERDDCFVFLDVGIHAEVYYR